MDLEQLSTDELRVIGDALAMAGRMERAAEVYELALLTAHPLRRHAFQVRLGLVTTPKPQTRGLFAALRELENVSFNVFLGAGLATWNKILPFLEDPRFVEIAARHAHLLPLPNWHWNLQTVAWAAHRAMGLAGDFVELGVFKGHTTLFLAEYLEFHHQPRQWFLYDTFEGIPEDQLDPGWETINDTVYKDAFGYEAVRDQFASIPNIKVIQGRVPEILDEVCPDRIAFLHMDLNNARAEVAALDSLYDRVASGGVIVFDDYGWAVSRAQHEAERAWFTSRGLEILPLPTGQGLFIKP